MDLLRDLLVGELPRQTLKPLLSQIKPDIVSEYVGYNRVSDLAQRVLGEQEGKMRIVLRLFDRLDESVDYLQCLLEFGISSGKLLCTLKNSFQCLQLSHRPLLAAG